MIERFMLNEELEEKVGEITGVDYTGMLNIKDIENIIKDLITEYNVLKEQIEDIKQDRDDNYTPKKVDPYEEYGVSIKDFV